MTSVSAWPLASSHWRMRPKRASASRTARSDISEPTPWACWALSGSEDQISVTAGCRSGKTYSVRMRRAWSRRGVLGIASGGQSPNRDSSASSRSRGRVNSGWMVAPPDTSARGLWTYALPEVPTPIATYSMPRGAMMSASVGTNRARPVLSATAAKVGSSAEKTVAGS